MCCKLDRVVHVELRSDSEEEWALTAEVEVKLLV